MIGCVTDVVVTVAEPGTGIGWEGVSRGMVGCWWGLGMVVETKGVGFSGWFRLRRSGLLGLTSDLWLG